MRQVLSVLCAIMLLTGAGQLMTAPAGQIIEVPVTANVQPVATTPTQTPTLPDKLLLVGGGGRSGGVCPLGGDCGAANNKPADTAAVSDGDDDGGRRRPVVRVAVGAGKIVRGILGHQRRVARREARRSGE